MKMVTRIEVVYDWSDKYGAARSVKKAITEFIGEGIDGNAS